MTAPDRSALCEHLERTRNAFTAAVSAMDARLWNFRPEPDAWSPAEIAEHLVLTEAELLERVRRLLSTPPQPGRAAELAGKDRLLLERVPVRRGRTAAPDSMRPTSRYKSPAQTAEAFLDGRSRTIRFALTEPGDLRAHVEPHFALGPLDAYQWLLLISVHTERHLAQIAEWTAAAQGKSHA